MMNDREALLRAILLNPTDDTPRLVYADWLEENGEVERAEFVRVQCEQARTTHNHRHREFGGSTIGCVACRLRHRERLLLAEYGSDCWGGWPGNGVPVEVDRGKVLRRGFVDEIRLPLTAFLAHVGSLFSAHPITAVRLTDREPYVGDSNDDLGPCWFAARFSSEEMTEDSSDVPDELFDLIAGTVTQHSGEYDLPSDDQIARFPTRVAALDALSAACCQYGRTRLSPAPAEATT